MKTARMPENELLDLIFMCFKRYNYWSLKALKAELKQPEQYLKDTLEKVAELVKAGRFAMNWTLKPENKAGLNVGNEQEAPIAANGFDESDMDAMGSGDDEDEDNMKMEDVLP